MLRDVQRQRRLAHGRPCGENNQFALAQAAGHLIEFQKAGTDAFDALAGIEEGIDAALVFGDNLRGAGQRSSSIVRRPAS